MSLSLTFLGGAPFQLLYDGVKLAIARASNFKTLLVNLETTLDCLQPRILQQISDHNVELNLPNDVIQDLQQKMDDGLQLIGNLSRLSTWSFRVWGDCCSCNRTSYADQLAALDRSLRRLLEILKLEQMRNVVELLVLSRRTNDRQDDLERRQLEILKALQELGDGLRVQQVVMERIERNLGASADRERGSGSAPAPAFGAAFRLLFDVVIAVKDKTMMRTHILADFESTLECLKPLVEELAVSNKVLHLPNGKQEFFVMQMQKSVELIHKCAEGGMRHKKYECAKELSRLDGCLQRLLVELMEQVVWNVKQAMVLVSNLEKEITKIEEGAALHSGENEMQVPAPDDDLEVEEIREVIEVNVTQTDDVRSQSTHVSWPESSMQSLQGTRGVIKERWNSEDEQDVKPSKKEDFFENQVASEYELPSYLDALALDCEDHEAELDMHVINLKRRLLYDDDHLALVLTGPELCGKTRLAEKFCQDEEVRDEFKNNIFCVPFSQNPSLDFIVQQLYPEEGCWEIALPDENGAHALQWLQAFAENVGCHRRSLLVLDDVWPDSESLLDRFAEFKGLNFSILVTSRFEFPKFGSSYYVIRDDVLREGR